MACENAHQFLLGKDKLAKDEKKLLEVFREKLHLKKVPRRIEAFDISNLQGGNAVGSMVSFENGKPNKERYRHFRIKTVMGADDTGMMYEVLLRRYQKAIEMDDLPDLVLLDGGRGQLNVGLEVFKELGIQEVDLISLAKERSARSPRLSKTTKAGEKVFHPQYKEPIFLGKHSPLLHLLDRIRDEAHRFAIAYHKNVRTRETIRSVLREIPRIGEMRQRELLKFFGSVEKIKEATEEELAKAPKMNRKVAQIVYLFFR
jgi:excinuclease ABC subunit C